MYIKRLFNSFCQLNLTLPNEALTVPVFNVQASNISIIKSPNEFYNTLKELSLQSKKRISVSSLYIGTGQLEKDLVCCFREAKIVNKNLEVNILLDYNRATRETISNENNKQIINSSKNLVLPLVSQGANVNFYLTYKLSGYRQWIQRKQKWNELCALHHMKLYIFDNNIIISGANLSDLYFTNRQDRYVLIRNSPQLCDYFDDLIKTISKFSMFLQRDGNFSLNSGWQYDPRKYSHSSMFKLSAKKEILKLNKQYSSSKYENNLSDTVIFPLLQMSSIDIKDEENFTSSLIKSCPQDSKLHLATGYFNLTSDYQSIILNRMNKYRLSALMASEEANGFFNGNGILRYIPLVYTHYVRTFLKKICRHKDNILIYYYSRPNWSFHAKGIWLSNPNYFLTMIGSTNYGYRSVYRDNEAQIVLLTKNQHLQDLFEEEHRSLLDHSKQIQNANLDLPKVPFWVSCFARLFRSYF